MGSKPGRSLERAGLFVARRRWHRYGGVVAVAALLLALTETSRAQVPAISDVGSPYFFAEEPELRLAASAKGDVLLAGRIGYRYTGELVAPVATHATLGGRSIPAGSKLFGVPMAVRSNLPVMIWCTPRQDGDRWMSVCLEPVESGNSVIVHDSSQSLMIQHLFYEKGAPETQGSPAVTVKPVEFGVPVRVAYKLDGWYRDVVQLVKEVTVGSGKPQDVGIAIVRAVDGAVRLKVAGGVIRIVQVGKKGFAATVEAPLQAGGSAIPVGLR